MDKFSALLLSGAVSGAIYSLIASGLVLTYSTSGIFNLGHGAVAFTTAFFYFELTTGLGWSVLPAAVVAILLFAPAAGLALDRLVFRRLAEASDAAKLVASVGLLVALPNLALWSVQRLVVNFGFELPTGENVVSPRGLGPEVRQTWRPLDLFTVDSNQVIILLCGAVAAAALWFIVQRTSLGLRMRVTVDRPELARLRGVNTERSSAIAWALGFGLAGLAGVLGAPLFTLTPGAFNGVMLVSATAAVLGGLRSIPLAYLGGLLIGIGQSMLAGYATFADSVPGFSTAVPFIVLFAALLVTGRDRARAAGQVADAPPPPSHSSDLPAWRRVVPWGVATVVFLGWMHLIADGVWVSLAARGLVFGLIFLSFVVVTGQGGMVSLAQAAFVSVSALTAGYLLDSGTTFFVALLAGVVVAVIAGLAAALPAVRLGALPLALSTLALGLIGDRMLFAWNPFRNSDLGWAVPRPDIGMFDLNDDRNFATAMLALVIIAIGLVTLLRRSWLGRDMTAVRSSSVAAASVGISPRRSKLLVFAVSAGLAGLGGVMLASFNYGVTGNSTPTQAGLVWLVVMVLFGIRQPGAAVLAGLVFAMSGRVIGAVSDSAYIPPILFGMGAIQLARSPDGILAGVGSLTRARRDRRRQHGHRGGDQVVRETSGHPPTAPAKPSCDPPVSISANGRAPIEVDLDAALIVDSVSAGYGDVQVVHEASLAVRSGSITALVGTNGAGKSTLCQVIAGSLPLISGVVSLAGTDVTRLSAQSRAGLGLMLSPESRGVFPGLTVEENLAVSLSQPADRGLVYERFPALDKRRDLVAGFLSGGEQQMLALAPAIVRPPAVFIADEPSLGLAPLIARQLMDMLGELRDLGTAVLLVEEKPAQVLEVANDVVFLDLGRVTWSGRASDVDADRLADALGLT